MSVDVRLPVGEEVATADPVIVVAGDLPAGRYRVRLVVETEAGAVSQTTEQELTVRERP